MLFNILIADDEKNIRDGLASSLEMDGYRTFTAEDGEAALMLMEAEEIDLVITDLRMPKLGGEELLKRINEQWQTVPVIVLTGHGTIENAVQAMRDGAFDFLSKPVNLDRLSLLCKRALANRELYLQHRALREELDKQRQVSTMIGKSAAIRRVFDVVAQVAPTKANVLITGESGVGKELVADALHNMSNRKDKPLIKVHCAALSESLLESELFGHEKGSFTGAAAQKRGRFELANGGTLFLDEIGEINQSVQIKILRVLQERQFERVGGEKTIEVDVRVVAATNKDLKKEIEEGRFREDLYYRLNVVNLNIPPLRERRDDIPLLVAHYLKVFADDNGKTISGLDKRARSALYNYSWPGNIRELRNTMESAVVMSRDDVISPEDLPPHIAESTDDSFIRIPVGSTMAQAEREIIKATLLAERGNKSKAADVLAIGRKTLHRKIEEYHLEEQA